MKRREFIAGVATLPFLNTELLASNEPLKLFDVSDWSDSHYIVARSGEEAARWWYTELGGDPVPDDVKIEEVDLEKNLRIGVEDIEELTEEDHRNYLYVVAHDGNWEKINTWRWGRAWPVNGHQIIHQALISVVDVSIIRLSFYVEKSAALHIQEVIENEYPLPCCIGTTAG